MLQKFQEYLQKKQDEIQKKQELIKAQKYYQIIKAGLIAIDFIQKDIAKEQTDVNRHERRRMIHDLNKDGKLSPEIVNYYQKKVDYIISNITQRLNPPKVKAQKNSGINPNGGYSPIPSNKTGTIKPPQGGTGECVGKHGAKDGSCLECNKGCEVRTEKPKDAK
jgi:hypothetical protein